MLFFITASPTSGSRISYSNTSHVILYLHLLLHLQRLELHSNTSHVILYQKYFRTEHILRRIQIHLMLFFIKTSLMYHLCGMQFKYISCYSLSSFIFLPAPSYSAFKYISCYSLSRQKEGNHGRGDIQIHLMLFFILFHFFLIPSYTPIQIHLMLFFIDILQAIYKRRNLIQIHLMLFFIYMHNYCIDLLWYSNTSHVILYRTQAATAQMPLMYSNTSHVILYLLDCGLTKILLIFKYISCYSLSASGIGANRRKRIQIHLMLFFIDFSFCK